MNLLERTDLTRSQIKRRFCRFTRTVNVNDMTDTIQNLRRKDKAEAYERKHKTNGQRAKFDIEEGVTNYVIQNQNSGTARQQMRSAEAAPFGWEYAG